MRPVRHLLLGAVLALLLIPQPTPAADEVGIFFDEHGDQNCVRAEPYSTMNAYLLLLDPSASGGVSGWECGLDYENVMLTDVVYNGQALNVHSVPDFVVGLGSPLPWSSVIKLVQLSVLVMGSDPVGFYIYPSSTPSLEGTPAYADGANPDNLLPMTPKTIGERALVAGINRPGCIPEGATWGHVKSLYD
jgi:hypothetical protein